MKTNAIVAEYRRVLLALDNMQGTEGARSYARPGRPGDAAAQSEAGKAALNRRLVETRLLTKLMQLEDAYGGGSGRSPPCCVRHPGTAGAIGVSCPAAYAR
jgi:hypothetical protein